MVSHQRAYTLPAGAYVIAVLIAGLALTRCTTSEDASPVSASQRAYWDWMHSINQNPASALESGEALLARYPGLSPLYLSLARICRETGRADACRRIFSRSLPPDTTSRPDAAQAFPDPHSALYREAALAQVLAPEEAAPHWRRIARDEALAPTLARLIVDAGLSQRKATWFAEVERAWRQCLAKDSTALGAAFGLGYAAVLRSDWGMADSLLRRVTRLAPDDPEAYRELGRLYFYTAQPEKLTTVLNAGIRAARVRGDRQAELILRGNLGRTLMLQYGDLTGAEQMFKAALEQSRALADGASEGVNLYRLADIRIRQQHYREALEMLEQADTLYARHNRRQHAEVLVLKGTALNGLFRFTDAEAALETARAEAEAWSNLSAELQALTSLAHLRYQMGRYTPARTTALDALKRARSHRAVPSEIMARMILGDVDNRWGNFEAALTQYEEALTLAKTHRRHSRVRELYQRLGRTALNMHNTSEAKSYYDALLEYERRNADTVTTALSYLGLGRAYSQFGNYAQAAAYFEDARELLRTEHPSLVTSTLLKLGWNAVNRSAYSEARTHFEEARKVIDRAGLDTPLRYRLEIALGNLDLKERRYRQALRHLREAERLEHTFRQPARQWRLLHLMALAHWGLGERDAAEQAFREAIATTEVIRENLLSRENRAAFVQDKVTVYKDFAAFLEAQGRVEDAFHFTERARSRSLGDLLFTTQQDNSVTADADAEQLIEAERRKRAITEELTRRDRDLTETPSDDIIDQTRAADLARAYREADSLYQATLNRLPEEGMFRAMRNVTPLSSAGARALLARDEAMIVYSLREDPGRERPPSTVAYVITPDTLLFRPLAIAPDDLEEAILFFRDQITASAETDGVTWRPTSRRLYAWLIDPLLDALPPSTRHLHLVPEGALYYLPFAALQDDSGTFLVERYSLSVTPSAGVLAITRAHNPRLWRSILLVADPENRLPGSRKEAEAIAGLPAIRALKLVGEQANRDNLIELSEDYDIIHIATHGTFVRRAPWFSRLELHGGALNVADIGRLRLNAYLVTLSACETALSGGLSSDIPAGDEWIGLNQAFLVAGAPTVMASLWPIDDRISASFMVGFYENLLDAQGKARALAKIQRQFIRDPHTHHPFFWAPFSIIGDSQ